MSGKKIKLFDVLLYAFFIIAAFVTVYPIWYVFIGSVVPQQVFIKNPLMIIPRQMTFEAYKVVISNPVISNALLISVFTTVAGSVISMLLTIFGAYFFSLENVPYKSFLFMVVLVTMFFGGGLIPMYIIFARYKLINKIMVYLVPGLINTFYMLILKTSFQEIPSSLYEASKIDGSGVVGYMFKIAVPLTLPAIATIFLFYTVDRWNDLYTAVFFIYKPALYNLQYVIYNMISGSDSSISTIITDKGTVLMREQVANAAIIAAILPILCVYPFLQKYFAKGVMVGAVKD